MTLLMYRWANNQGLAATIDPATLDVLSQELIELVREQATPYTGNINGKIQTWQIFYYV